MHFSQKTTLSKASVGCKLQILLVTINGISPTNSIEILLCSSNLVSYLPCI